MIARLRNSNSNTDDYTVKLRQGDDLHGVPWSSKCLQGAIERWKTLEEAGGPWRARERLEWLERTLEAWSTRDNAWVWRMLALGLVSGLAGMRKRECMTCDNKAKEL